MQQRTSLQHSLAADDESLELFGTVVSAYREPVHMFSQCAAPMIKPLSALTAMSRKTQLLNSCSICHGEVKASAQSDRV